MGRQESYPGGKMKLPGGNWSKRFRGKGASFLVEGDEGSSPMKREQAKGELCFQPRSPANQIIFQLDPLSAG